KHGGSASAYITNRTAAWHGLTFDVGRLTEGNEYEVAVWVKLPEGSPDSVIILTAKRADDGDNSSYNEYTNMETVTASADKWTLLKGFYTQSGTAFEHFIIESSDDNISFYADDFSIGGEVADSSSDNTPTNTSSLRRPLSPEHPMFMVHIDTWNTADPQKVIDLIPEDIRPYTVFVLSMSIFHKSATNGQCNWELVEYGVETAKSWLRTAAENGVWAMIQPSSGGFTHLPDYGLDVDLENTIYGELFRDYPNFLGINYAEQFWGFDDGCSPTFQDRWTHWANLLKLTHKYGGYLAVSFTGGFWGAALNPVAMVKSNEHLAAATRAYTENFIIQEKQTAGYGFHDIESISLGMYLSGYAGHYGIRPDSSGWNNNGQDYPPAAGAAPLIEHLMLTGETVIDGPELIWQQSIRSLFDGTTADGYRTRQWDLFPQFENIHLDIYRRMLDGTIRIPDRQEVIDRTKVVIVNDTYSGDDRNKYSSPQTLFRGLYLMDDDGTNLDQLSWFKKSGRYPAIPTVWQLSDDVANSFQVKVNRSDYDSRWPNIADKVNELNNLFPQESTGDLYVARNENAWVSYNPYRNGQSASAHIPFQYNSCSAMDLTYAPWSSAVIKEYRDKITFYLTNYTPDNSTLKTDVILISGATSQPVYSFTDTGDHPSSDLTSDWSNGTLTLNVNHNGPLEITVNCSGTATDRRTGYTQTTVSPPAAPMSYTGPRQYEGEHFDFKNIGGIHANAVHDSIRNYQGMGYVNFGKGNSASVRDYVKVPASGNYMLKTRYYTDSSTDTVTLYINGVSAATPTFNQTSSNNWATDEQLIYLNEGTNEIEFRANGYRSSDLYIDNIVLIKQ
ncbi:glycoside hydrolase family 98 domain-containing protein, partial [Gynuella sp.]|uniref:glycoside hydrolase family 98 domain-containing protein n=1 Tax=Gynuella sp. TaxID=2969146 RepID=UPI003D1341A6